MTQTEVMSVGGGEGLSYIYEVGQWDFDHDPGIIQTTQIRHAVVFYNFGGMVKKVGG